MLSKLCSIGKLKVKIVRVCMFEALLNVIFFKGAVFRPDKTIFQVNKRLLALFGRKSNT